MIIVLFGCSPFKPPVHFGSALNNKSLTHFISKMDSVSNMGILVSDANTGEIIISQRANQLFTPASNVKVLTAASAIHYLGPDFRFVTTIYGPPALNGKQVKWLALKGSGDPFLSLDQLDFLAVEIAKYAESIDTLIIDASLYDEFYYGPGWMWDEGSDRNGSPVGGLNLNWNTVDIYIESDEASKQHKIILEPETQYVTVTDSITFTMDSTEFRKLSAERWWWKYSNLITVHGNIFRGDLPDTVHSNIFDPVKFTAMVFQEKLQQNNVKIGTNVYRGIPSERSVITETYSPSLKEMTNHFLKETDNLVAEAMLKQIGITERTKQGSWDTGLHKINLFISDSVGVDTNEVRIADGSGLSRYNLLSPSSMVKILNYIAAYPEMKKIIVPALPVSGLDGTLKERMTDASTVGKVIAKTGSLGNVSTLSGFIHTHSGRTLVFSIMMNGFTIERKTVRKLQDDLCKYLVEEL